MLIMEEESNSSSVQKKRRSHSNTELSIKKTKSKNANAVHSHSSSTRQSSMPPSNLNDQTIEAPLDDQFPLQHRKKKSQPNQSSYSPSVINVSDTDLNVPTSPGIIINFLCFFCLLDVIITIEEVYPKIDSKEKQY